MIFQVESYKGCDIGSRSLIPALELTKEFHLHGSIPNTHMWQTRWGP